jgi:hypothetical protein
MDANFNWKSKTTFSVSAANNSLGGEHRAPHTDGALMPEALRFETSPDDLESELSSVLLQIEVQANRARISSLANRNRPSTGLDAKQGHQS